MDTDTLVTVLLARAVEIGAEIQQTQNRDLAIYLKGCKDTLHSLAKAFQQPCPLAVQFFNSSVVVKEVP